MKPRALVALAALLATGLAACGGDQVTAFSFPEAITSVSIEIAKGSISIDGDGPESQATVEATARFSGNAPEITVEVDAGAMVISHTCSTDDCAVDYTISLADPAVDVSVSTGDGNIAVIDVDGPVELAGGDGDVAINGITGDITVDVARGGILGARLVAASASFTSQRGNVDVTFDEPIDQLTVVAKDGNATAQLPGGPYRVTSTAGKSSNIQIETVESADRTITIEASGDVTIYAK